MPQIGWFEILIIVILSILVIGPKDFPVVPKKIGSWFGSIKGYINKIQSSVTNFEEEIIEDNEVKSEEKKSQGPSSEIKD